MSFYFDDYDDDHIDPSQGSRNNEFHCPDCGSSESYTDDTGQVYCANCHAQSQTQQNEAEMDFAELELLGAKGRTGRLLVVREKKGGRKRRPYSDLDNSKKLPTLEECLQGYSTVILVCLKAMQKILALDDEIYQKLKKRALRIWLAYLKSWEEGAEFYRKYHPEVRISLRDSFFSNPSIKNALNRFLFDKAVKKVRKERNQSQGRRKSPSHEKDYDLEGASKNERKTAPATVGEMLNLYKRQTHKEAALKIRLSMTTVAAFVLAATWGFGVTGYDMNKWIMAGEIPLLNAYKKCLSEDQQDTLYPFNGAFRLFKLPPSLKIEYLAKLILIAARRDPILINNKSAPAMVKRLVQSMQLPPEVSENAIGILAQKVHRDIRIPRKFIRGSPLWKVNSTVDVLAVVAVGCKMCDGWEQRVYCKDVMCPIPWNEEHIPFVKSLNSYLEFVKSNILDGHPLNKMAGNPLPDFLIGEKTTKDEAKNVDDSERSSPRKLRDRTMSDNSEEFQPDVPHSFGDAKINPKQHPVEPSSTIWPPKVVAGIPNPKQPHITRLSKYHDWKLKVKEPNAIWADANGIGKYVYYSVDAKFNRTHPHYQLLLEHMSYLSDISAYDIHKSVCTLDDKLLNCHYEFQVRMSHDMLYGKLPRPRPDGESSEPQDSWGVRDARKKRGRDPDDSGPSIAELARKYRYLRNGTNKRRKMSKKRLHKKTTQLNNERNLSRESSTGNEMISVPLEKTAACNTTHVEVPKNDDIVHLMYAVRNISQI